MNQFHTESHGPNEQELTKAIAQAIHTAMTNNTQVVITIHMLSNYGILEKIFGDTLKKKRMIEFKGVRIYLETERSQSDFLCGVAVAPFCSLALVETLKNDHRITDLIYLPWQESELSTYKNENPNSIAL